MSHSEKLIHLPFFIKGRLSAQEAEEILFGQAQRGTNIACVLKDQNGELVIHARNPSKLIRDDNMCDFAGLHSEMQAAEKIIINY